VPTSRKKLPSRVADIKNSVFLLLFHSTAHHLVTFATEQVCLSLFHQAFKLSPRSHYVCAVRSARRVYFPISTPFRCKIQHQRALMSSLGAFGARSVKKRFHHRYHLRHNASEKWQRFIASAGCQRHAGGAHHTHFDFSFSLLGMKRKRTGAPKMVLISRSLIGGCDSADCGLRKASGSCVGECVRPGIDCRGHRSRDSAALMSSFALSGPEATK
jgi:hypothetical protein